MCMDDQPQHVQLITMNPQHAAVPISPALRAGKKRAVDFDVLFPAVLRMGIILPHCDESPSAFPWALS